MFAHLGAGGLSRFGQKRVGVGAAFQRPWLEATGSQTDARLGNQPEDGQDADAIAGGAAALLPGQPDLHGVLEAQLPGELIGQQGGLGHQQADQVVGQQVDPQLLHHHRRGLAAQPRHAEGTGKPGQTTLFSNSVKLTEKLSNNGLSPTPASASKSVRPASVGGRAVWVGLACPLEPNLNTYSGNRHEPTRD